MTADYMEPIGNVDTSPHTFTWNNKNLEVRSLSVERTLEPLVVQVTTLVNTPTNGPSGKNIGQSKRAEVLISALENATANFLTKGEEIAYENPDMHGEIMLTLDEVRSSGQQMSLASREFVEDPCSSHKRSNMMEAARLLLSAVTRLLIVADMVDVHRLLKSLRNLENDLLLVKNASSQQELIDSYNTFRRNTQGLIGEAGIRQNELKDWRMRSNLAAARAVLKKNSTLLLTASKVYIRHPELSAAKENRDYVFKEICEAVTTIGDVAQGKPIEFDSRTQVSPRDLQQLDSTCLTDGHYKLALAIDEFDRQVAINPAVYSETVMRPLLEESLEKIISGAASMADSPCTRMDRQDSIVGECNALRQALQDLLSEYMANMEKKTPSDNLNKALDHMLKKTRDLRRHLRKAVIDHVSDSFLDVDLPLRALVDAALTGDELMVKEAAEAFSGISARLVDVAYLACCMATENDNTGVESVRHAIKQLERVRPQVINSARVLVDRPNSQVARDNMRAFEEFWRKQARILTACVDNIISIDDFLAVSENHIIEDVNKCILALQEKIAVDLSQTADIIRGRSLRVCEVVQAEMARYEPSQYTETVLEAIMLLEQSQEAFKTRVESAVSALGSPEKHAQVDENEFIDATRAVYDGVRQIRLAVLQNRTIDELDSETEIEYEENTYDTRSKSSAHTDVDEFPDIAGISNTRDAYRFISDEDKEKIAIYVETFRTEKKNFDKEVAIWDDNGNVIISMAKKMCMIMMEMTDFTRGRGPLKTTMDVINAAKKISEYGLELDKIARLIADQSPESVTKDELLGLLNEIALYCQQLNITSRVKADVQNISGNLIVSGLDSATSLIQAAKNLMNAVVSTVKTSYVASTKYTRPGGQPIQKPIVVWRMKAPEKKPLIRRERPDESRAKIRRGTQKKNVTHLKALNEFESTPTAP
ncbi:Catenin alpha, partial [Fragariocoptes setiger]